VWQLDNKACREGTTRSELFIHREMTPRRTQACPGPSAVDKPQCWEDARDYRSEGCVKLSPSHIKQAAALAGKFGGPTMRRWTGKSGYRFRNLLRVTGG
jgi:hypothetical protein